MVHQSPPREMMDALVMAVVEQHPGRRLADIHYDPGTPGMDYQDTKSTLRRLVRQGRIEKTYHQQGWFVFYTYRIAK